LNSFSKLFIIFSTGFNYYFYFSIRSFNYFSTKRSKFIHSL